MGVALMYAGILTALLGVLSILWAARLASHPLATGGRPGLRRGPFGDCGRGYPPGQGEALVFSLEEEAPGCWRLTETRVFAPDRATFSRLTAYWCLIYPGSSLLRTSLLDAIQRKAEAGTQEPLSSIR